MAETVQALTVRKTVVVNAPRERAFQVFTTGFDSWWPRGHHIAKVDMLAAVLEPKQGGRWFEKGVDGSECDWGRVLVWDPPARVMLSWHLNGRWEHEPSTHSEVDVRFIAEGPSRTRVELEHRGIERHAYAEDLKKGVDSPEGWTGLLQMYLEKAQA
jgi:uncharacterized protein YndB with AHSA1/START domain